MNEKYRKLTNPEEFVDDVSTDFAAVEKGLLPGPIESTFWINISERLWHRLIAYGAAYELHFQQVIEPVIDTVLMPEQCESLVEELEFLLGIVDDPAFEQALGTILNVAGQVINRKDMRLVISPP